MDWHADAPRQRALLALAAALILAASSRVTLPLAVLVALVALLAVPMSLVIAWLSRGGTRPPAGDDDGDFAGDDLPLGPGDDPAWGEVVPFVRTPAEPLPRPVRPAERAPRI